MIMDSQEFLIPLNGLTSGRKRFCWNVGKKFFEDFGNAEILDASLSVVTQAEKCGHEILVDGVVSGSVTVLCDRCMDELDLPVETLISLEVRYDGRSESAQAEDAGPDDSDGDLSLREKIFLSPEVKELDMRQIIYDYVCLALPLQRFHEDGRCNPSSMKILSSGIEIKGASVREDGEAGNENPFSALRDIFKEKSDNNN